MKTLKKLWNYEIGFLSREGSITVGDVCQAVPGALLVFGLIGVCVFLWIIVYTPHC